MRSRLPRLVATTQIQLNRRVTTTKKRIFTTVTLLVLAVAPNLYAAHCSTAASAGEWSYTYTGTIFTPNGPLPVASVHSRGCEWTEQRTGVLAMAYDNNQNHGRGIFQSLTLPDGTNIPVVITLDSARVFIKE